MHKNIFSVASFIQLACLLVILSIAPDSFAEIFKCVDETTGKIAFTDHACPDDTPGEYQPTGTTNADTRSASPNRAGSGALRNEKGPTGSQKWVGRAKEVGTQQKPEPDSTAR